MRKYLDSYPHLVKEFDFKKNYPLTPKDLSFGTAKKVWWKCTKGHKYISAVGNRTLGINCPFCSGKKVGDDNNLKILFPDIAKEWHPTKNGNLKPENVTKGSNKKVWWKCEKGHEWQNFISTRTTGINCSFCSGRKVSKEINFKILFPDIAKEWHPTKNGNIKPEDVTKKSGKKVWWKCEKGHEWLAVIANRTAGHNCPFCSGKKVGDDNNLKILFPDIAKEWHPTKNGNLKPENVTKGSNKKVWWRCEKGHEWKSMIALRTGGINCQFCLGKKVSKEINFKILFPDIAKEWHPTKNGNIKPEDVTRGTPKKYWWKCIKGHEWFSSVNHRTNGRNCPKCSGGSSKPEFRILSELESIFKIVDSRHKFKKTEIDIFIKDINVGIEYDGFYYHNKRATNDEHKNIFFKRYIKKLIRVRQSPLKKLDNLDVIVKKNELIKKDLNNILNSIYNFCNNEQKILIEEYLKKSSFVNEKSYNKYLSYFPSPIPEKSLNSLNLQFVKEWNYEKNYPLTPDSFSTKSNTKVWWKCEKGHEWKTVIANRTTGRNCPFCSGKKASDDNNLKILFPDIAKEWHPTKNGNLKPENVTKGSKKIIWWKCIKKGHEWEAFVSSRIYYGRNCPFCSGKKVGDDNNLKILFPDIAKEWHPTKNGNLKPEDVTKGYYKKVWWRCEKGHEWLATVFNRTKRIRRSNCPHCYNIKRKFNSKSFNKF